ncbi:hypothetical protein HG531_012972 [Fusarium graminearum]|nr:hypothetical protein HG531_012972 [Fusarium graminearum]
MKLLKDVANSIALADAFSICDSTIIHARNASLKNRVDDVVDLVEVRHDKRINLSVKSIISITLVHLELVELNECLVHASLIHLKLLLLVSEKLLEIRATISDRLLEIRHLTVVLGKHRRKLVALAAFEVVGPFLSETELTPKLLNFILAAATRAILVMKSAVTLTDHVGQLQVLRLDLTLELLASVDGLLCAGRLELNCLEFL